MTRTMPNRMMAALLAVLFLLAGAEAGLGMHVCPVHDVIGPGSGHASHANAPPLEASAGPGDHHAAHHGHPEYAVHTDHAGHNDHADHGHPADQHGSEAGHVSGPVAGEASSDGPALAIIHDCGSALAPEPCAPGTHHGEACTCLGTCQVGSGTALASARVITPVVMLPGLAGAVHFAAETATRRYPPYFLPYALGPPAHG